MHPNQIQGLPLQKKLNTKISELHEMMMEDRKTQLSQRSYNQTDSGINRLINCLMVSHIQNYKN